MLQMNFARPCEFLSDAENDRRVPMLSVGSIVWGVEDVPRAIKFWCAALDYKPRDVPSVDWAATFEPRLVRGFFRLGRKSEARGWNLAPRELLHPCLPLRA